MNTPDTDVDHTVRIHDVYVEFFQNSTRIGMYRTLNPFEGACMHLIQRWVSLQLTPENLSRELNMLKL